MAINLKHDVRFLKGVGEVRARQLYKLGIATVEDLLMYLPVRYEDRKKIQKIAMLNNEDIALIKGVVISISGTRFRRGKNLMKISMGDGSGTVTLLAFNQPFLKNVFTEGSTAYVHGKFIRSYKGLETSSFTYEIVKSENESPVHVNRIVPIYGLTSGIGQKWIRKIIYETIEKLENDFAECIPQKIIDSEKMVDINCAVKNIHFPDRMTEAFRARERLAFGDFFIFQIALAIKKNSVRKIIKPRRYNIKRNFLTPFKKKLGFEFTVDQKKAINEIFGDLTSPYPMRRLLQGEVGSGKTVVALSAVLLAVENSYMGVVIAPTEILAEQHYLTFKAYLDEIGVRVGLLKGGMTKKAREAILNGIVSGETDIIVGTHALLQKDVDLSRAGIMIIDEQHRFGVNQKAVLAAKSENIDLLAMSATPIPRTLAMCSYGDLDVSVIRELPKDRKKPLTKYVRENEAYLFALNELKAGNLVYIVHPLIEESDNNEWKSARDRFGQLSRTTFREYNCGLLHGRMSGAEKEEIMRKFSTGEYRVLFTTTVVEVGINVPRATVMIIENFNRYGLSALHQLRGRIARSSRQPYCLLTGRVTTPESKRRMKVILSTTDGFKIAEEDLKIRGGGELFGTRQHGAMNFRIGDPLTDFEQLVKARRKAFELINADGKLEKKENLKLKKIVIEKYKDRFHLADV